jgi:LPS sulfotransferase NodH
VRPYLVCSVPRTGSSLLCSLLSDTGLAGDPIEYFNSERIDNLSERWGVAGFGEYVAALARTATPNGVFGSKLHAYQLGTVMARARTVPGLNGSGEAQVIEALFPGVRYILLRRRDKVRQAISWLRAERTKRWGRRRKGLPPESPDGEFDLDAVTERIERAAAHEAKWAAFFKSSGSLPWVVEYEELVVDVHGLVNVALEFLGVHPGRPVATARPPTERQSDSLTEEWVSRYEAALAAGIVELPGGVVSHDACRLQGQG